MIKCPNFIICENYKENKHKVCNDCDMLFGSLRGKTGILNFSSGDCSICSETEICVAKPDYDHILCTNCFKECYFGNGYIFNDTEDTLDQYLTFINKCKNHFKHLKEV